MSRLIFQSLGVANLVLFACAIAAVFYSEELLPHELNVYLFNASQDLSAIEITLGVISVAAIVGNIGIVFLKPWARQVYTFAIIFTSLGMILVGPTVSSSLETMIAEVSQLISGILIGVMYFSPISKEFTAKASPTSDLND